MSEQVFVWVTLGVAFLAANLPWLSDRFLFFLSPEGGKRAWMRLLEWVVLYGLVGAIAVGMEKKGYGRVHDQQWEFFVVTVSLFAVFALPGVIYQYILKPILRRR